ncbi:GFA family protein [Sphingobium sp. EM0848]|uniref:GFA family protein n=1 Tax=Sphingobium sp. EM0848 TaxID=2743473 RepID=UPI00159C35B3|nr:GFA family protein [Sphingobium sp. EM0848]
MIEGGCNCGAVRYRCEGKPIVVAQCHCRNCQRQSGSAFSVNLLFKASAVTQEGELTVYEDKDTFSGNPVMRKFCGTCGSSVFSEPTDGKGMLIVKAGTLDDPSPYVPAVSVWTSTAMPWVELPAGQHKFERNP